MLLRPELRLFLCMSFRDILLHMNEKNAKLSGEIRLSSAVDVVHPNSCCDSASQSLGCGDVHDVIAANESVPKRILQFSVYELFCLL